MKKPDCNRRLLFLRSGKSGGLKLHHLKMIGVGVGVLAVASAIHPSKTTSSTPTTTTTTTTTAPSHTTTTVATTSPTVTDTSTSTTTSDPSAVSAPIVPTPSNTPKFSSTSFWYTPLPATPPLDPNSANLVVEFQRQIQTYYGNVGVNTQYYSSPIYIAAATAPTQQVTVTDCHNNGWIDAGLVQQWTAVPIPSYAQPAAGTDSEMAIYQPATDTLWEFWEMKQVGTAWTGCWGGRMTNVSGNPGIWTAPYGAAATGLPFAPGQVTVEELQSGVINHVIGIAVVDAEHWDKWSWPANRSDGWNPTGIANRIREGQRFRIDPTLDIDTLSIGPIAKMVAKAG